MHGQVEPQVILERYGVKRFVTQQLQEQAGKHAGMMAAFCERMGWRNLEMLIAAFQAGPLSNLHHHHEHLSLPAACVSAVSGWLST